MTNETQNKYERIGSWDVNTQIPQTVRNYFRELFAEIESGKPGLIYIANCNLGKVLKDRFNSNGKSLEEQLSPISEKIKTIAKNTGRDKCFVEHLLIGSTSAITPNPFISEMSYFADDPQANYESVIQQCDKKQGTMASSVVRKIKGKNVIQHTATICIAENPLQAITENPYRGRYGYYGLQYTINPHSRKAIINPGECNKLVWN